MIRQADSSARSIVAHRGVSAVFPENTRRAFEEAVICGADAIEFDIQVTADLEIVICHNPTLDHYGYPETEIASSTLTELQALDIGRKFGREFVGERLMTLPEMLRDFGTRIPLYVEFKTKHMRPRHVEAMISGFLKLTSDVHDSMDLHGLCFDQGVLCELAMTADWLPLVWNTNRPQDIRACELSEQPWLSAVGCRIGNLNRRTADMIHVAGLQLFSFTCNSKSEVLQARRMGVDSVISDDPVRTRRILHHAASRSASTRSGSVSN